MKIGRYSVTIFKIKNRSGYAAVCSDHLTEGSTRQQAMERMEKAVRRTMKKSAKSTTSAKKSPKKK